MNEFDTIDILEKKADLLFKNVQGWELSTIKRIARRIGKYGRLSQADLQAINNIAIVKNDLNEIFKELADVTAKNISQIEGIYGEVLEEQHLANKPLYDYRGKPFVPFAENKELQSMVRRYAKTTGGTMLNLSNVGAKRLGVLEKVGTDYVFKPLQNFYTDALDKAVMQVASGATDFHTVMRDTVLSMGGSGIRVQYASGVTRGLDTVVRQALLYAGKQASDEYNKAIGDELGCDGIEIRITQNARPSHQFMQGLQYSLVGEKTINGKTYKDAKSEGVLDALDDYNCRHNPPSRIILGVSEPAYSNEEIAESKRQDKKLYDIDGKKMTGYEASQAMRRLENEIRKEKSIMAAAEAEGHLNTDVANCRKRIKTYQAKYNQISEITGIAPSPDRMRISKAVNANKTVDFSGNGGKIKDETSDVQKIIMSKDEMAEKFSDSISDVVFNPAENIEQAKEFLKSNLGIDASWDYDKMNVDVANTINKEILNAYDIFGNLSESDDLKSVFIISGKTDYYAAYQKSTRTLMLNKADVTNKNSLSKMKKSAEDNFKMGFWSTNETEHAIRHEIGHAVVHKISSTNPSLLKEKFETIAVLRKKVMEDCEIAEFSMDDTDEHMKSAGGVLSYYALKNDEEFITESIAEYMSRKPRHTAKMVVEILMEGIE